MSHSSSPVTTPTTDRARTRSLSESDVDVNAEPQDLAEFLEDDVYNDDDDVDSTAATDSGSEDTPPANESLTRAAGTLFDSFRNKNFSDLGWGPNTNKDGKELEGQTSVDIVLVDGTTLSDLCSDENLPVPTPFVDGIYSEAVDAVLNAFRRLDLEVSPTMSDESRAKLVEAYHTNNGSLQHPFFVIRGNDQFGLAFGAASLMNTVRKRLDHAVMMSVREKTKLRVVADAIVTELYLARTALLDKIYVQFPEKSKNGPRTRESTPAPTTGGSGSSRAKASRGNGGGGGGRPSNHQNKSRGRPQKTFTIRLRDDQRRADLDFLLARGDNGEEPYLQDGTTYKLVFDRGECFVVGMWSHN